MPIKSLKCYLDEIPAYDTSGSYSSAVYDNGGMITARTSSSEMQLIRNSSLDEFAAYITKLTNMGFVVKTDRTVDGNRFVSLVDELRDNRVYTYYYADKSVRVILDNLGTALEDFESYLNVQANGNVEFYQYGLHMSTSFSDKTANKGLLNVIKCADNSVIIVDGGEQSQMNSTHMAQLDSFLHEITGKADGEKITISCWYLTHGYMDHTQGFYEFMKNYHGSYELQRIMANLPACKHGKLDETASRTFDLIGKLVKDNYPNCMEMKVHNGQSITVAGVRFDVLYTHEDLVNTLRGTVSLATANNASVVTRVSAGDMSMLVTGDIYNAAANVIVNIYSTAIADVDILQVAHHCFYNLSQLYPKINADYVVYPQSLGYISTSTDSQTTTVHNYLKGKYANHYYSGDGNTVGFYHNGSSVVVK